MENRKITAKTIVLFIVSFCVLISIICIPFYSIRNNGYMYSDVRHKTKSVQKETENSLDMLILGDSEGWATFSPLQIFHEYGIASYNCSTPGQWTGDSAKILIKALKRQDPSVVVLETSAIFSNPNPIKYALSEILPVFHYHNYYKNTAVKYGDQKTKGANLNASTVAYTGTADYMSSNMQEAVLDKNSLNGLNTILELCNEQNIDLVLVSAPSALTWTTGKHLAVARWAEENAIPYIDYNEKDEFNQLSFNWSTDTRDGGDHVNLSGSKKVCTDFGKRISEMYSFVDHRSDSAYAEWEEKYKSLGLYK